jgi:hypothetical protein
LIGPDSKALIEDPQLENIIEPQILIVAPENKLDISQIEIVSKQSYPFGAGICKVQQNFNNNKKG